MCKFKKNQRHGFTLIELLVVIAIIGVLASVVLSSLESARASARDAKRQSDLRTIATALELYYLRNNSYPNGGAGSDQAWWATGSGNGVLTPLVTQGFLSGKVPSDPGRNGYVGTGCGGAQFYAYWSDGQRYLLGAVSEAQGNTGCTQNGNWRGPDNTAYRYQYYIKVGL